MSRTRIWLNRIGWTVFVAVLSVALTLVFTFNPSPPVPPSPFTRNLPGDWSEASRELGRRVAAQFPPGSRAEDLAQELDRQGFVPADWHAMAPVTKARRDESSFVCRVGAYVEWQADAGGRLISTQGHYREEGCL